MPVSRTILTAVLIAALFGGIGLLLVWYLSFGMAQPSDGDVKFERMQSAARLSYYEDGSLSIVSDDEADAYRALGFHMGREHAWTAALLRQTAIGRLGKWFDEPVLKLDAFAARLGFASHARESVEMLDQDDRAVLTAFSEGMTRALRDEDVALRPEFVLFGVVPEDWEDWHSLAVGRLLAWLSMPPTTAEPSDSLFWAVRRHEDEDRLFRSWLHLHGADMSAAWSFPDSTGRRFSGRLVYGASALPLFTAVSMTWPSARISGVATIGTPFFPVAVGPGGAQITLNSSARAIERQVVVHDAIEPEWRHERVIDRAGNERVIAAGRYQGGILLNQPQEDPGDSLFTALVLQWTGFDAVSDWPAWRAVVNSVGAENPPGTRIRFQILDGDGLVVRSSSTAVTGAPPVETDRRALTFVAGNPVARFASESLRARPTTVEDAENADLSRWARSNVDKALSLVGPDSTFDDRTQEALDYLRNWDYRYDRSSIGASVFDGWMLHHRSERGEFPTIQVPTDSLERAQVASRFRSTLIATIDSMASVGGSDLARWRLEYFRPGRRYFPVWSFAPIYDELPGLNRSRYAPIDIARSGHPTTINWQPGLDDEPLSSPSHILFSGVVGESFMLTVTPDYEMGSGFVARYVAGPPRHRTGLVRKQIEELILTPE